MVTETENYVLYREVMSNLEPRACFLVCLNTLMGACHGIGGLEDLPVAKMENFE